MNTPVLIVGAGPTGLMLGCQLALHGVPFRLIEKRSGITDKSKAIAVQARTLELFDIMGIAEKALANAQKVNNICFYIENKPEVIIDFNNIGDGISPYPYVFIYEQFKTEKLLYDFLQNQGAKVEWDTELLNLVQKEDKLTVSVKGPGGMEEGLEAGFVIGADGASSLVRHSAGLKLEGETYSQKFFLLDAQLNWDFSHHNILLFMSKYGLAGFFPMSDISRYRVIGPLPERLADNKELSFEEVKDVIDYNINQNLDIHSPHWMSSYKLHHRGVKHFNVGGIYFAGDAAHVHSPVGGQGMNTGLQDAFNLAWKLAMVINKQAPESLLETYHSERYPVAQVLLKGTDRAFTFAISKKWYIKFFRMNIFPYIIKWLSGKVWLKKILFRLVSQTGIQYRKSTLSVNEGNFPAGAPKAGDRPPFTTLEGGKSIFDFLHGKGFHLLLFEGISPSERIDEIQKEFLEMTDGSSLLSYHFITGYGANAISHKKYGANTTTIFLIRPDGYICYRCQPANPLALRKYIDGNFINI